MRFSVLHESGSSQDANQIGKEDLTDKRGFFYLILHHKSMLIFWNYAFERASAPSCIDTIPLIRSEGALVQRIFGSVVSVEDLITGC